MATARSDCVSPREHPTIIDHNRTMIGALAKNIPNIRRTFRFCAVLNGFAIHL
jgi:hypothetical protein